MRRPAAVLRSHRHRAPDTCRWGWVDLDLVFDRGDGRPVHPDVFSRYFHRPAERVGLQGVRLHDLRHAFATNLMRAVGTKDTSAALGHASESFTMAVYQHLVPDAKADLVVEAITRLYGGE
jgi:integrase